jgi:hypothetical protein
MLVRTGSSIPNIPVSAAPHRPDVPAIVTSGKASTDGDDSSNKSAPGALGQEGGGLYTGPTSSLTALLSFKSERQDSRESENRSPEVQEPLSGSELRPYDDDLLQLLPQLHIIDGKSFLPPGVLFGLFLISRTGLVDFYFEYCNWMYRHVHPQSFLAAWNKFKTGQSSDRLVLATLCVIMALAIRYIPSRHGLLQCLPPNHDELCDQYYALSKDALSRYRQDSRGLSLELVELLLVSK